MAQDGVLQETLSVAGQTTLADLTVSGTMTGALRQTVVVGSSLTILGPTDTATLVLLSATAFTQRDVSLPAAPPDGTYYDIVSQGVVTPLDSRKISSISGESINFMIADGTLATAAAIETTQFVSIRLTYAGGAWWSSLQSQVSAWTAV